MEKPGPLSSEANARLLALFDEMVAEGSGSPTTNDVPLSGAVSDGKIARFLQQTSPDED